MNVAINLGKNPWRNLRKNSGEEILEISRMNFWWNLRNYPWKNPQRMLAEISQGITGETNEGFQERIPDECRKISLKEFREEPPQWNHCGNQWKNSSSNAKRIPRKKNAEVILYRIPGGISGEIPKGLMEESRKESRKRIPGKSLKESLQKIRKTSIK